MLAGILLWPATLFVLRYPCTTPLWPTDGDQIDVAVRWIIAGLFMSIITAAFGGWVLDVEIENNRIGSN